MKLIVNIPVFNEEEKIAETIRRVKKSFESDFYRNEGSVFTEKMIQITDDGSKDKTLEIAKKEGVDYIYPNPVNRGPGVVFKNSVQHALENGVDVLAYIDADGQFDPDDIPKLISPILNGEADMVSADRFGDKEAQNMPRIKYHLNKFAAWLIRKFMNYPIKDLTCGFRAYSRETLLRLNLPGGFTYTQESIIDILGKNLKIKWIPVVVTYYEGRKSRVVRSIYSYVNNSAKIILKAVRDVRPMKFFGFPGLFLIGIAIVVFVWFLTLYFQDFKISPYRNYLIFSISSFLIGLQFLVFALIADMIKSSRKLTEDQTYMFRVEKYKK